MSLSEQEQEALNKDFKIGDVVEFAACPGTLFEITDGDSPFWNLERLGGPELPDNYYEACFGVKRPDTSVVIETILHHSNPMEVLAIMARE